MILILRACLSLLACLVLSSAACADEGELRSSSEAKGNLSAELEQALSQLLDAAGSDKILPAQASMETVMRFVTGPTPEEVRPAPRSHGSGAYVKESIKLPLKKLISYMLHPNLPGEVLYPASVRRSGWVKGSQVLTEGETFLKADYPPAKPLLLRGREYEETTPDTSSGCYYSYILNRLFVLWTYQGRTVLFSISNMPQASAIGMKGAIVGKDETWSYVYAPEQGTNLPMLGWAKTQLYGSASVTVFVEPAPGSSRTDICVFKWAKAGWSGMNVVKPSHITDGVKRFAATLRQALESPQTPDADALAAQYMALNKLSEKELVQKLTPFGSWLNAQSATNPLLREKAFQQVLKDNAYASTLKRDHLIAELIKLHLRDQLGLLPPELASATGKLAPPPKTASNE